MPAARFQGRLVNIHPSLLPAFTGLHTHRRALAMVSESMARPCTLVEPALDSGPILAQAVVPVLDDDDEHRLARWCSPPSIGFTRPFCDG
ncbi:MAG: formyltransferase family protein [Burkholderiaceae bacterium]